MALAATVTRAILLIMLALAVGAALFIVAGTLAVMFAINRFENFDTGFQVQFVPIFLFANVSLVSLARYADRTPAACAAVRPVRRAYRSRNALTIWSWNGRTT